MGKKLIASIGPLPVVHKEIIQGHIFPMQRRLFQKLFAKIGKGNVQTGTYYRYGNVLSATLKSLTLLR